MMNDLKKLRREKIVLHIKCIMAAYNMYWELLRIKDKHPELFEQYKTTKKEFWCKVNESKFEIKKALSEEYRELKQKLRIRYWFWLSDVRKITKR
jgi:hypothetical protein